MIWLASFPRSGNTYFRNILFEVYGIESSSFHHKNNGDLAQIDFMNFDIVKTHLLPSQLPEKYRHNKSVYLVRDGRDALVSIAHHRKDIVAPGSNYNRNLAEAILAKEGSFFGGWGGNVRQWMNEADLVIKYEDLIKDPIGQVSRLAEIIDLPEPRIERLPTFNKLKNGTPHYGSGTKDMKISAKKDRAQKFYRRGIAGSYKDEMPYVFRFLFWLKYKGVMKKLNYH